MQEKEIQYLLIRYKENKCSEAELSLLDEWYFQKANQSNFILTQEEAAEAEATMWENLNPAKNKTKKSLLWYKLTAAAVIVVVASVSFYFYKAQNSIFKAEELSSQAANIKPGNNKAILTLSNGKVVYLDKSNKHENLAKQMGVNISTVNNELVYTIDNNLTAEAEQKFNKIETPNGGQYQVRLPDGTKVWLNAASSLKYPLAFASNQRNVELTGEAYFEVAKDASRPFMVKTENQTIQVLGTHFNINSYADEKYVKTTLLEGSVRLTLLTGYSVVLKPGQQAIANQINLAVKTIDAEKAIAWKNGYFDFNKEELSSILRKISRWYDVEISYQGDFNNQIIYGSISKTKNIQTVLNLLTTSSEVKFKIEGRRVIVMKK